jgi:hypothetical protein
VTGWERPELAIGQRWVSDDLMGPDFDETIESIEGDIVTSRDGFGSVMTWTVDHFRSSMFGLRSVLSLTCGAAGDGGSAS